ncbi:hypothetical protein BY458DRAFT_544203 [Sporodiniella umbellata]|nr:hypothetical protein BY458DRAFT_544203 [Sporodiniella umbellata]
MQTDDDLAALSLLRHFGPREMLQTPFFFFFLESSMVTFNLLACTSGFQVHLQYSSMKAKNSICHPKDRIAIFFNRLLSWPLLTKLSIRACSSWFGCAYQVLYAMVRLKAEKRLLV